MKAFIMIDLQEQFDIIALRDELNKLIDGDNAIGLSMKIYDILDILYKQIKMEEILK